MYYKNLPYLTFWGMAVDRLVHDHAPSTCVHMPGHLASALTHDTSAPMVCSSTKE